MNQVINKSCLYKLNPIIKGILCISYILLFSFSCKTWLVAFNLNLFIILFCFYIKEDTIGLLSSIKRIWLLLIVVGLFQGFSAKTFDIWGCLSAIFRLLGVYLTANLYTRVSPQNELLYFWEICFKPLNLFRFSSNEIALMMVIAIRFLPVFMSEIERIRMAQIARGAKLKANAIVSAINFMPLIIPVLNQAIMRSNELADAMEVRGYVPGRARGRYKDYKLSAYDFVAFLILAATIYLLNFR